MALRSQITEEIKVFLNFLLVQSRTYNYRTDPDREAQNLYGSGTWFTFKTRVGIKKPTQKNPQKNPPKKTHKNAFFGFFLNFLFFMKIIQTQKNPKNPKKTTGVPRRLFIPALQQLAIAQSRKKHQKNHNKILRKNQE